MARIFITGSTDGLGLMAARLLITKGHHVVLHARNEERKQQALSRLPGAEDALIADLSGIEETIKLAKQANETGRFDAVIHNAGIYDKTASLTEQEDSRMFLVNSLAPYILTCLMQKPERLIYMSSGMHLQGEPLLEELSAGLKKMSRYPSYSDTKLHDVILCMAVARKWPEVYANAVNPGWVPTKMGGPGAPDDLEKGYETQAWLAVSDDPKAKVSGRYFRHQQQLDYSPVANDVEVQEKFLAVCEELSGVGFPDKRKG